MSCPLFFLPPQPPIKTAPLFLSWKKTWERILLASILVPSFIPGNSNLSHLGSETLDEHDSSSSSSSFLFISSELDLRKIFQSSVLLGPLFSIKEKFFFLYCYPFIIHVSLVCLSPSTNIIIMKSSTKLHPTHELFLILLSKNLPLHSSLCCIT